VPVAGVADVERGDVVGQGDPIGLRADAPPDLSVMTILPA
jgi:hypothetical protein